MRLSVPNILDHISIHTYAMALNDMWRRSDEVDFSWYDPVSVRTVGTAALGSSGVGEGETSYLFPASFCEGGCQKAVDSP